MEDSTRNLEELFLAVGELHILHRRREVAAAADNVPETHAAKSSLLHQGRHGVAGRAAAGVKGIEVKADGAAQVNAVLGDRGDAGAQLLSGHGPKLTVVNGD